MRLLENELHNYFNIQHDAPTKARPRSDREVLLVDTHLHTTYSDGAADIKQVEDICLIKNIGCCVTDHNEIRGSLELLDRRKTPTLPSLEIGSQEKIELILYFSQAEACEEFYKDQVEPFRQKRWYAFLPRPLAYLVEAALEHQVLISVPHPFAPLWKNIDNGRKRRQAVDRVLDQADCIEICNGSQSPRANRKAFHLCQQLERIPLGGSDSHDLETIGSILVAFNRPVHSKNLFQAMAEGQIFGIFGDGLRPNYLANTWHLIGRHSRKFISAPVFPEELAGEPLETLWTSFKTAVRGGLLH